MPEHSCGFRETELARTEGFEFGIEDHGFPFLWGTFLYEGAGAQGFGMIVDTEFLKRFMRVFGYTEKLARCNGQICRVTHCHDRIHKVAPVLNEKGAEFDVDAWVAEKDKEHEHA